MYLLNIAFNSAINCQKVLIVKAPPVGNCRKICCARSVMVVTLFRTVYVKKRDVSRSCVIRYTSYGLHKGNDVNERN